jgi:hypothetical protein
MPRWVGAMLLLIGGLYALYLAITQTTFYLRGEKPPMPIWAGKAFHTLLGVLMIVSAFLILFLAKD